MDLSNLNSFLQVLTVANFSYSGFEKVRNPLNNAFRSIPTVFEYLERYLDKKTEKLSIKYSRFISINEKIDEKSDDDFVFNLKSDLEATVKKSNGLQESMGKYKKKVSRVGATERVRFQFYKKLPPIYLMSALFCFFIIFLNSIHSISNVNSLELLVLFLSFQIIIFHFYIILITFFKNEFPFPNLTNTLLFFFTFLIISFFLTQKIDFNLIIIDEELKKLIIVIIVLVLSSFSFLFHFVRQIQIKTTYSLCKIKIYISTLFFNIILRNMFIDMINSSQKRLHSIFKKLVS